MPGVNAKFLVSDGQSGPNNGISQAQLQTNQRDGFISHSHFQSTPQTSLSNEKAISQLKKKKPWHNALGRLSLQSSFIDGTGGRKWKTCFHFISRVLPRFIWQRGFKCIGLMTMSRQFLNWRQEEKGSGEKKNTGIMLEHTHWHIAFSCLYPVVVYQNTRQRKKIVLFVWKFSWFPLFGRGINTSDVVSQH